MTGPPAEAPSDDIEIDGQQLDVAAVTAVARLGARRCQRLAAARERLEASSQRALRVIAERG